MRAIRRFAARCPLALAGLVIVLLVSPAGVLACICPKASASKSGAAATSCCGMTAKSETVPPPASSCCSVSPETPVLPPAGDSCATCIHCGDGIPTVPPPVNQEPATVLLSTTWDMPPMEPAPLWLQPTTPRLNLLSDQLFGPTTPASLQGVPRFLELGILRN